MKRKLVFSVAGAEAEADCRIRFAPSLPEAERIVALGFRYWMRGGLTGDLGCWERAWSLYSGLFGATGARIAVSNLSHWVKAVQCSSRREIEVMPDSCRSFCRDECIAVSMIAACQHNTCPALRACAFALVETSLIDSVVDRAQTFADTMAGLDHVLSQGSIIAQPVQISSANLVLQ